MGRQYNFIYKQLVDGEGDIAGHVAYSLYKSDKISFIEKFKREHDGKEPSEEDFRPFHDMACMEANLERYKMHSVSVLRRLRAAGGDASQRGAGSEADRRLKSST